MWNTIYELTVSNDTSKFNLSGWELLLPYCISYDWKCLLLCIEIRDRCLEFLISDGFWFTGPTNWFTSPFGWWVVCKFRIKMYVAGTLREAFSEIVLIRFAYKILFVSCLSPKVITTAFSHDVWGGQAVQWNICFRRCFLIVLVSFAILKRVMIIIVFICDQGPSFLHDKFTR